MRDTSAHARAGTPSPTAAAVTDPVGVSPFPTYAEWLAGHSDDALVDLLWRLRAFHSSTQTPLRSYAASTISGIADVAALRQLDAVTLATLHALIHAGATHHPVEDADLSVAINDLFDAAGTPTARRPTAGELTSSVITLAHHALAFGPHLHLDETNTQTDLVFPVAVPEHLHGLFSRTTDVPWVLVDGYRCPIPTEVLPATLSGLPAQQRRIMTTLTTAGGMGYSANLDDPDRPLAKMISAGLLDRVNTDTVRVSPRVSAISAHRISPDPGGDFRPVIQTPTDDRTDAAGVARVVETLRHMADLLTELGTAPMRPLSRGGVGVREITRISRSLGESVTAVSETLILCRHADLISRADGIWGVTLRGRDFLEAGVSGRWALTLLAWSTSAHAPWQQEDVDSHLLDDHFDNAAAAALRQSTPMLLTTLGNSNDSDGGDGDSSDGGGNPSDPAVQLWRMRPSLAARTLSAALNTVLAEAEALGLCAANQPTRAAEALDLVLTDIEGQSPADALDALTRQLDEILPDPVRMLIIQADLTVLAPGLLAPDTEGILRRIADIESAGMASLWRISPESLRRAAASGLTADQVRAFLSDLASDIPQNLDYLVNDIFRPSDSLVADTTAMVLTAPSEATLSAALAALDPADILDAGLRRIAPTVAVSRTRLSRVVDILDDAGVHVEVEGTAAEPGGDDTLTLVPDPRRPDVRRQDVVEQLEASVEAFRRSWQVPEEPTGAATVRGIDTTTVRDPRAIMSALRAAYDQGTQVEISYVNADGAAVQEWISVVTMSPVSIVGVTESEGISLRIQPHRIAWVATPVH